MFVSMNWIKEYVDLSGCNIEELIHRFTLSTAEVEDIIYKGRDISGVVVGEILSVGSLEWQARCILSPSHLHR